jgi:Tol biopolymer transport system component
MTVTADTQLGPYRIVSPLGAGGMGEVFRARDTRLGRDVAVKVLPEEYSSDAQRLARFRQEACAAGALNHPNILTIYDVDAGEGAAYVVSELLEGETLRERLRDGALPPRKAVEFASQVAAGLAAAHEHGIVHRDIKPENIFITSGGRAKILDFGLAKLTGGALGSVETEAPTRRVETTGGGVMGTVGYMSPEQARGLPVDRRSDIFSLGVVLYEMLAGARPFKGDSAVETLNAIIKEDPPELSSSGKSTPEALARVVLHCLEKKPDERFQSARDLAFALDALSTVTGQRAATTADASPVTTAGATARTRRKLWPLLACLLALTLLAAVFYAGTRVARTQPPTFRQLTFRRGAVWSARFAPDGQTVIYGAAFEGAPIQIYSGRTEVPESRPLGLPDGNLLAVSPTGELAVLLNADTSSVTFTWGTLARVPLTGGAPREVLEDVAFADWSPDGKGLAVVHRVGGRWRLEYPIGKVLYETHGHISYPRFSPKGDVIAFMDHPLDGDDRGTVAVVDFEGRKRTLTKEAGSQQGLAWSPDGDEVWFAASANESSRVLQAVTLAGRQRVVASAPGDLTLLDISRDGRALLTRGNLSGRLLGLAPGETKERDLSWFDSSIVTDVTADGRVILFREPDRAAGEGYGVYLRKTDGSPAVRLGDGVPQFLSPDGKWALATSPSAPSPVFLLPTGVGEPRQLTHDQFEHLVARVMPDGKRFLFDGGEPGHDTRAYLQDLDGGEPRPVTPEGTWFALNSVSPDGKYAAAYTGKVTGFNHQTPLLFSFDTGATRPLSGVEEGEGVARWSADGRSLYVFRPGGQTAKVYRVDTVTGRRELWKELTPPDPAGNVGITNIVMTPDARSYFYTYFHYLSDLYLVEGLK